MKYIRGRGNQPPHDHCQIKEQIRTNACTQICKWLSWVQQRNSFDLNIGCCSMISSAWSGIHSSSAGKDRNRKESATKHVCVWVWTRCKLIHVALCSFIPIRQNAEADQTLYLWGAACRSWCATIHPSSRSAVSCSERFGKIKSCDSSTILHSHLQQHKTFSMLTSL